MMSAQVVCGPNVQICAPVRVYETQGGGADLRVAEVARRARANRSYRPI